MRVLKKENIFSGYNFMIVDDHAYVRSMLQGVLTRLGTTNVVVASGIGDAMETFRLLKSNPNKVGMVNVDIVFVDYRLGGGEKTGWDLVKYMRKSSDSFNPHVRIIGLTAFADREVLKHGRDVGLNGVIAKPFNGKAVYNQVLDTINDNRSFIEYVDGSYFGPERYENRKQIDRDGQGEFWEGIKKISQVKNISQKLSGDAKDVLKDSEFFEEMDANILEGASESREELKSLVMLLHESHKTYKDCGTEAERIKAMKVLGVAAHKVRDSDGMFLYPVVGKVAAYVERLAGLEGVTEHKHTAKILEGLLGLQILLLAKDAGGDATLDAILRELEKLMKVIGSSLSPEAESLLFA